MSAWMNTVANLAKNIGVALGGPVVPAVIEIGKDFLKLLNESQHIVNATDAFELQKIRDELEPKVLAHADATEQTLRGKE